MRWLKLGVRLATVCLIALPAAAAQAAPKAELWAKWTANNASSTATIPHNAWDAFLKRHVRLDTDGIARVAYRAIDRADRAQLAAYIAALESVGISGFNRREQLAYWINLYNAVTVKIVAEHPSAASVRDINISPGLFATGPWGKKVVMIEREPVSLDDIEHRILRPIWRDPRIHYAVNCASLGCPNLLRDAFTAANADALLNAAARNYVNHPRGMRIEAGRLTVSSIYVWFKEDFGGTDAGVLAHLRAYADAQTAAALAGRTQIDRDAYDWRLNDIK
ncbi:MAG: DUF547 domain-containing protein [Alphaproteobacteria bacterium]